MKNAIFAVKIVLLVAAALVWIGYAPDHADGIKFVCAIVTMVFSGLVSVEIVDRVWKEK